MKSPLCFCYEVDHSRQAVFICMHVCVHWGHVTPHDLIQFLGSTNWQEVRKSARLQASVDQRQKQLSRPRSICLHSSTLSNRSISWIISAKGNCTLLILLSIYWPTFSTSSSFLTSKHSESIINSLSYDAFCRRLQKVT